MLLPAEVGVKEVKDWFGSGIFLPGATHFRETQVNERVTFFWGIFSHSQLVSVNPPHRTEPLWGGGL